MTPVVEEIEEIVQREGSAWDNRDIDKLLTVFHDDMVWVWPQTGGSHDPLKWLIEVGGFDRERWRAGWEGIFKGGVTRNVRDIRKVTVSPEGDAAVAIVDVEVEWINEGGEPVSWIGRVSKVYSKMGAEWKMITHNGL